MNLGADPKKTKILIGLFVTAGVVYWMNSSSDAPAPTTTSRSAAAADPVAMTQSAVKKVNKRRTAIGPGDGVGVFSPEAPAPGAVDPSKVDPTVRLDMLAKVQAVEMEGGVRNIFKVEAPPPDPTPVAANQKIPEIPGIKVGQPGSPKDTPASTKATQPLPTGPPPAPPINLKYYGYSTKRSDGEKKAFFLDGEDIIVASEGDVIKKQYKVVRISNTSVQMEDTANKNTQTLPLTPEANPA